jgi:hypothetical protein
MPELNGQEVLVEIRRIEKEMGISGLFKLLLVPFWMTL